MPDSSASLSPELVFSVHEKIKNELSKTIAGQDVAINALLLSMFCEGHCLLVGVPGLAKTLLVRSLAETIGLQFSRIQFTPDLMPGDILGSEIIQEVNGKLVFDYQPGPVFANLVLADEINRTPPKTQSALLEAMQERHVTVAKETRALPSPFVVVATQNPIEHEGTYPLPEAQLDRFLMKILIGYPTAQEEEIIVGAVASGRAGSGLNANSVPQRCTPEDILHAQALCAAVEAVPEVVAYAVRLVRATREMKGISLGAGTRGAIALVRVAKAFALMAGRGYVIPDDVKSAVRPVLRHRVQLAPELAISGQQIDFTLEAIVKNTEAPRR